MTIAEQRLDFWKAPLDKEIDLDWIGAYEYDLSQDRIATDPADRRDRSRLLVLKPDGGLTHEHFENLGDHLRPGDLLVFNNTRVVPARLEVFKDTGGQVELFALHPGEDGACADWTTPVDGTLRLTCMTRSSKPLRPGMVLGDQGRPQLPALTLESAGGGEALVRIPWDGSPLEFLEAFGEMPLPPYIVKQRGISGSPKQKEEDKLRYQTVYASVAGAVAAPTAGLHFTRELLADLDEGGVKRAELTLTVGPGTFRPVRHDRLSDHPMHREEYFIPAQLKEAIESTRQKNGRVIAVGTTSARALEAEARRDDPFAPGWKSTDIFLRPGESFRICDGLITNFHLPCSTLLALVAAFAGYEEMRKLYNAAVAGDYRFYSYGDASLLLRPAHGGAS